MILNMKRYILYILVAVAATGCRKEPAVEPSAGGNVPIALTASVEDDKTTKALVGSTTDGDKISIEDACGSLGGAIGFWTDKTTFSANGQEQHDYDIFNIGGQARLTYDGTQWVYNGDPQSWSPGARYNFVAYYPQSMYEYVLDASSSTSINTFVIEYNTHNVQEDLMVAYNEVYTEDPKTGQPSIYRAAEDGPDEDGDPVSALVPAGTKYGFSEEFKLKDPVPLHLRHTMAAVKVQFRFEYDDSDEVLECWFENPAEGGLHTVGTLVFGIGSMDNVRPEEWPEGGATIGDKTYSVEAELEHDEKNAFAWQTYQTTGSYVKMYNWEVNGTEGIPFSYAGDVVATAYTQIDDLTAASSTYTDHDGWILFLPQEVPEGVKFYYRLKSSANEASFVTLPSITGTPVNGVDCYVAGHRYTYTVSIKKTNAYASVTMEPWNELFSSNEIYF